MIDIDKLAESVGMIKDGDNWFSSGSDDFDVKHEHLLKFAAAVVASINPQSFMSWQEGYAAGAAAEREACAALCEQMDHDGVMIAADCAEAIRARGQS